MNFFVRERYSLSDMDLDESKNAGEQFANSDITQILCRRIRRREVYEGFRTNLTSERSEHTPAPHRLSIIKKGQSDFCASGLRLELKFQAFTNRLTVHTGYNTLRASLWNSRLKELISNKRTKGFGLRKVWAQAFGAQRHV